jgi:thiamine biosynthesis lipoprotein
MIRIGNCSARGLLRSANVLGACWALTLAGPVATASSPSWARYEFRESCMGTQFRIAVYAASEAEARAGAEAGFARIRAIDQALSDYRDESELARVLRQATNQPIPVSAELERALRISRELHRTSEGSFDVTSGPLVRLWREARRRGSLPSATELAQARARSGWSALELTSEKPEKDDAAQLVLKRSGVALDFGGIGKGLAVEEAFQALKARSLTHAMVSGSGDIRVGDPPPGESGWKIGIAEPTSGPRAAENFVFLKNQAISTSGDGVQFVEIAGKRYSHIVDPKTGLGLTHGRWVTAVAPDAALADAAATAASILPRAKLRAFSKKHPGLALRLIDAEDHVTIAGAFPPIRLKNTARSR